MENKVDGMTLSSVSLGLVGPVILGMVKLYADHGILKAQHRGLQSEVNELKDGLKSSDDKLDKRFDKIEALIEKLYLYEMSKTERDH